MTDPSGYCASAADCPQGPGGPGGGFGGLPLGPNTDVDFVFRIWNLLASGAYGPELAQYGQDLIACFATNCPGVDPPTLDPGEDDPQDPDTSPSSSTPIARWQAVLTGPLMVRSAGSTVGGTSERAASQVPLGADRNYDPGGRGYHYYELYSDLICSLQAGCTPEFVFSALRRYPAPGWDPRFLVSDFDTTNVTAWWEPTSPDTVYHLVDPASLTVYNITASNHVLRYGEVRRSVVVQDGVIRIKTVGVGNNVSAARAALNRAAYRRVFAPLDQQIRDYVSLHLPGS